MFEPDIKKTLDTQKDSYRKAKNVHKAYEQGISNRPEMEWIWTGLTSFLASHAHQEPYDELANKQ
jgi:hypothetical protein